MLMLSFRQWLEDAGEVINVNLANTIADDGFSRINSKYMSGKRKDLEKKRNPEKIFGKIDQALKNTTSD